MPLETQSISLNDSITSDETNDSENLDSATNDDDKPQENMEKPQNDEMVPPQEEKRPLNPRIETLAQQIHLMKKGEWIIDGQAGATTKINSSDNESKQSSSPIEQTLSKEKKEITLKNGTKVVQQRVGSNAFKRKDDDFSLKRRWKRIVPYDFRIGELADLKSNNQKEHLIVDKLTNFFTIFATQKKIDQSFLLSGSKDLISNNLNYVIDSGAMPDTLFRIGKVNFSTNNIARVNIRFYYKNSCADGEVILEASYQKGKETDWLISDIQVDFMKLLSTYEGYSEPYLPSSYQHFDWE